jgi:hypothetical protein
VDDEVCNKKEKRSLGERLTVPLPQLFSYNIGGGITPYFTSDIFVLFLHLNLFELFNAACRVRLTTVASQSFTSLLLIRIILSLFLKEEKQYTHNCIELRQVTLTLDMSDPLIRKCAPNGQR